MYKILHVIYQPRSQARKEPGNEVDHLQGVDNPTLACYRALHIVYAFTFSYTGQYR